MFGIGTKRQTWNDQWGPEPVMALRDVSSSGRRAPVTLPGGNPFTGARASSGHLGAV